MAITEDKQKQQNMKLFYGSKQLYQILTRKAPTFFAYISLKEPHYATFQITWKYAHQIVSFHLIQHTLMIQRCMVEILRAIYKTSWFELIYDCLLLLV